MTSQRYYRLGDTGAAVAEIRAKLATLGLLPADEATMGSAAMADAVFDAQVDQAVRCFQQQRALTVDGVVGPQTYRALDEARWKLGDRILQYSVSHLMSGDDVAQLQRRLLDMGFDCGRVDGIFGKDTERALREFQHNVGLAPDGQCGPRTLKALSRLSRTVVGGEPYAMRESEMIHQAGPSLHGKTVVIDPGHGGGDRGVVANGLEEAAVVWDLANRVEGRLAATGVQAYLTRGVEGELDEVARAHFANATGADLVISLHVDRHRNPVANGVAAYYYGNDRFGHHSAVGEKFAGLVQREIVARTGMLDCLTHERTWDLLRRTRMPAVRIELGYLTNPGDAARLADPGFRDTVAEAIVVAVQRLYLPPEDDAPTGMLHLPELIK
ncbi:N-acetylmuramoyl-L-alanine amidase [Carbonactinospora thermoautotrophica]|uniref:N-acetylmuramoyl-L-alanine amidase n=1 Tax=Carbonactinospora thermoautotrophica TaxID=1469144 RepID=UPI00226F92F0|nr:N-acetylmuramoyl-L-alanine amidase [Carbonactinospora thermoautotrophica]MCX9192023.1 N-acetylmuramoyl-L-alanine amidase [Carbonactinospora thermoautotrophica]